MNYYIDEDHYLHLCSLDALNRLDEESTEMLLNDKNLGFHFSVRRLVPRFMIWMTQRMKWMEKEMEALKHQVGQHQEALESHHRELYLGKRKSVVDEESVQLWKKPRVQGETS